MASETRQSRLGNLVCFFIKWFFSTSWIVGVRFCKSLPLTSTRVLISHVLSVRQWGDPSWFAACSLGWGFMRKEPALVHLSEPWPVGFTFPCRGLRSEVRWRHRAAGDIIWSSALCWSLLPKNKVGWLKTPVQVVYGSEPLNHLYYLKKAGNEFFWRVSFSRKQLF